MKKEAIIFILFLLFTIPFVFAADNITDSQKTVNAYACLNKEVNEKTCGELTTEEKIFVALATGNCKNELKEDSSNNECWPEGNCNIKTTAQAILALRGSDSAENWLISKNISTSGMNWYLEIDSDSATTCTITYDNTPHAISIGEDKKISSSAGGCLSLSSGNYWLTISEVCYDKTFEVSCDNSFISTFLFKKEGSDTIHVLKETKTSSAGGSIDMQIQSSCFSINSECDYEGTLWATLALNYLKEDTDAYIPYLITTAEDNSEYLPESFIYYLTDYSDMKTSLSEKQKTSGYWEESGDRYYDTAIALYPFSSESFDAKTKAKEWLFQQQDEEGCFQTNIRNTAFILYSIFPKTFASTNTTDDCVDSGYYCMSPISCSGEILDNYECAGTLKCCNEPKEEKTCSELLGETCSSNKECSGTTDNSASDLGYGETCCISGICQDSSISELTCETNNGRCTSSDCSKNEEEDAFYTCEEGDICCVEKTKSPSIFSSMWIWILLILIVLVLIGFFFRDKLSMFWMRLTSGRKRPSGGSGPKEFPRFPTTRIPTSLTPSPQRRILPTTRPTIPKKYEPKKSSEMEDVLKKLKELGK